MTTFLLDKEFITLAMFLKVKGYINSGGETLFFIYNNKILLNKTSVKEKRKKIFNGDILIINNDIYKFVYESND